MPYLTDLPSLIRDSHSIALEHGWWERPEDNDPDTKIALCHSEVSEALEEFRAGHPLEEIRYECQVCRNGPCKSDSMYDVTCMVSKEPIAKPEGFTVELADLLIRLADMCGRWGWEVEPVEMNVGVMGVAKFINTLHDDLGDIVLLEEFRPQEVSQVFGFVLSYARSHNLPLERALQEKMAYNRTRPHRHGNKVA